MSDRHSLEQFVHHMPKVELHVHLEGSIQPQTLLELARRHRVDLPADDEDGLRRWFRFRDFEQFVQIYLVCCQCLRDPEDFQLVVDQFLAEQERQNVLYTEMHFTIGTHLANGVNGGEVADAIYESLTAGERQRGVRARLIPDIVRDVGPERADQTLEWALAARAKGVVALGLSGFESSPNEPYREHFQVARDEGLHRVAHAGEHQGPQTIRSVLEVCQAERIGHGIRAVDDPELMAELVAQSIPLEICPTSNLRLGAVPEMSEHPVDTLRRAGIEVTINSDDPALFDTTLTEEYERVADTFGYSASALATLSWTALRRAFLAAEDRELLEQEFGRRLAELDARIEGDQVLAEL